MEDGFVSFDSAHPFIHGSFRLGTRPTKLNVPYAESGINYPPLPCLLHALLCNNGFYGSVMKFVAETGMSVMEHTSTVVDYCHTNHVYKISINGRVSHQRLPAYNGVMTRRSRNHIWSHRLHAETGLPVQVSPRVYPTYDHQDGDCIWFYGVQEGVEKAVVSIDYSPMLPLLLRRSGNIRHDTLPRRFAVLATTDPFARYVSSFGRCFEHATD